MEGQILFEDEQQLSLQEHIQILGVTVDCEVRYDTHVTSVARHTSQGVSALRRVAASLDSRCIPTLYKSQICLDIHMLFVRWGKTRDRDQYHVTGTL